MTQLQKMGAFIKELREEKNITQEEMAIDLDVSSKSLSRWENGGNISKVMHIIAIAEYFKISVDELISGERKPEIEQTDTKEELKRVASYIDEQNLRIIKRIHIRNMICLFSCFFTAMLMDAFIRFGNSYFGLMQMIFLIITLGIIIWNFLYTSGFVTMLCEYQKSNRRMFYFEIIILVAVIALIFYMIAKNAHSYFIMLENFLTINNLK